jgi:hypothetical protein
MKGKMIGLCSGRARIGPTPARILDTQNGQPSLTSPFQGERKFLNKFSGAQPTIMTDKYNHGKLVSSHILHLDSSAPYQIQKQSLYKVDEL